MMWALLVALVTIGIWAIRKRLSPRLPLPPGPKPLPLIGNLLDMSSPKPWETYHKWSSEHDSDIIFLRLPMQPMVVLSSLEAAVDLFEKRSHIYSDRIELKMYELLGWDFTFGFMSYGSRWRAHRRHFHQYFNQNAVLQHRGKQLETARRFLTWVLESPQDTLDSVHRFSAAVIFQVAYGMKITGLNDPYVLLANKAFEGLDVASVPGAHWVEFLPFLHKIPGNSSRKIQREFKPSVDGMITKPYEVVKQAVADGTAGPSVARSLIERVQNHAHQMDPSELEEYERMAKNVSGVSYAAGTHTTDSAMESFLLAMALFPDVQKKAQEELDRVVGPNRLPEYEDLESLVYIRATAMEAMRWIPVLPVGIPHRLIEDDVYKGYFLPKGSLVVVNAALILHNPEYYPEPEKFNPGRFIGPDGKINPKVLDPSTVAFGFGRRICPGRYFSNNTLVIFIASLLHVFDITPGLDENGEPMKLTGEWKAGLFSGPVKIPRGFKPRSAQAERLVRDVMVEESFSE